MPPRSDHHLQVASKSQRDKSQPSDLQSSSKLRRRRIPTRHQPSMRPNNRLSHSPSLFSSFESRSTRSSSRGGDTKTTTRSLSAREARNLPVTQRTLRQNQHPLSPLDQQPVPGSTWWQLETSITDSRRIGLIQSRYLIWPQREMAAASLAPPSATSVSQTK